MSKICSVEGCNGKYRGNGYCSRHYYQMRKHGTITSASQMTKYDRNESFIENNICHIKLRNEKNVEVGETIIDEKYSEIVLTLKWHLNSKGYASCNCLDENNRRRTVLLHQAIILLSGQEVPNGYEIDHKDTNRLNCLENNLRICTPIQNKQHKSIQKNNTSGHKGVSWNKQIKKWKAVIVANNVIIRLGNFNIKEDAARAYNAAATKHFGEFAVLNDV